MAETPGQPDPFIQGICETWHWETAYDRTDALSLPRESTVDEIIAYFIADYVDRSRRAPAIGNGFGETNGMRALNPIAEVHSVIRFIGCTERMWFP